MSTAQPAASGRGASVPRCVTAGELLDLATARLTAAGVENARLDAEVLLAAALNVNRAALHSRPERAVDAGASRTFETGIRRRQQREPLAYILGRKEFWSLDFEVCRDVLIPRPETELVVEIAVRLLRDRGAARPRICELCTGSGCVAVAIATEVPNATIVATDVSPAALAVAGRNAGRHGVEARIDFVASDLFSDLADEMFDLVVANPPYAEAGEIRSLAPEVRSEPAVALSGGADGLATIRRLIPAAASRLARGGWLVMEIGATQGAAVERMAAEAGFSDIRVVDDYAGLPRVLVARGG